MSDRHLVSSVIRFAEVFTCHEIGFGGTAIFIWKKKFWTSNEESELRKEDEHSTARITILYVCIRIYMLNYVYEVFGLYILVYRWEGFGRICIVLY